jgi:hypothetical protein
MIKSGQVNARCAKAKGFTTGFIPLLMENLVAAERQLGSIERAIDAVRADANDELNAYTDLCVALACKNIHAERHVASKVLNSERRRKKRPELKDFHLLTVDGGDGDGAFGGTDHGAASRRSHLRRGHIRRLSGDRITWVNQTMVTGQGGFAAKAYSVRSIR